MNFITGAARSGTSLTASVFKFCGANLGEHTGLFENVQVKRLVNNTLKKNYFDPLGQKPLPNKYIPLDNLAEVMPDVDVVKQCKILLFWEEFHRHYPEAKWVFVRRDVDQIADSCMRTNFLKKYDTHEEWVRWANTYLDKMEDAKGVVDYIEVWPSLWKEDPEYPGMKEAVEFLGFDWDDKARSLIDWRKLPSDPVS